MKPLQIISADSLGGLIAGIATLLIYPLLADLHNWSEALVLFMAIVNIAYGCYSGILFLLYRKDPSSLEPMVITLIIANSAWAGFCFTQLWWIGSDSFWTGSGHLILEGIFVAALAFIEAMIVLPSVHKS
ncbi:MAG: hypothetical protein RH862_03775 [Leptospiraceae bacterium]